MRTALTLLMFALICSNGIAAEAVKPTPPKPPAEKPAEPAPPKPEAGKPADPAPEKPAPEKPKPDPAAKPEKPEKPEPEKPPVQVVADWDLGITPRDLPGRCTVAITAKVKNRGYFGTGSVISPLGYVLTSTTVVPPKSTEMTIVSPGHYNLKGTLVLAMEKIELALVRVEFDDEVKALPAFAMRDSSTTKLGEVVMTVSNSFQVARNAGELSVSVGLLSGRYACPKKLAEQPVYLGEMIETTAATNPGSDGGPLLDGSGQLVGVLSLNTSNARWLGVAVPVEIMLPHIRKAVSEDLAKRRIECKEPLRIAQKPGKPLFPHWEERAARFRSAVDKVSRTVVAIQVDRKKDDPRFTRRRRIGRTGPGSGRLFGEMLKRPKGATVTGVVVDPNGWIATSYFNIAGQLKSLKVTFADGKTLPAKVVGWDQERDLALLQVEAKELPAIELSSQAWLGQDVCVLGRSPSADSLTLTSGIVSAIGRRDNSLLQFDAKANVGNTGGPLVGLDGRCLGIVGGISTNSRHGQNSGIAFAAWSKVLPKAIEQLQKGSKIRRRPRAVLGIVPAPGAVDLAGILVARVSDDGGAAKAGIKRNDSITHIDGQELEGVAQLINYLKTKKPGDKVTVSVRRLGKKLGDLEIVLGQM
jgi:S1-C subfamily serine protease